MRLHEQEDVNPPLPPTFPLSSIRSVPSTLHLPAVCSDYLCPALKWSVPVSYIFGATRYEDMRAEWCYGCKLHSVMSSECLRSPNGNGIMCCDTISDDFLSVDVDWMYHWSVCIGRWCLAPDQRTSTRLMYALTRSTAACRPPPPTGLRYLIHESVKIIKTKINVTNSTTSITVQEFVLYVSLLRSLCGLIDMHMV